MRVFEYILVYENKNGETIQRYVFAEDADHAVGLFYQSTYSIGATLISCKRAEKKD